MLLEDWIDCRWMMHRQISIVWLCFNFLPLIQKHLVSNLFSSTPDRPNRGRTGIMGEPWRLCNLQQEHNKLCWLLTIITTSDTGALPTSGISPWTGLFPSVKLVFSHELVRCLVFLSGWSCPLIWWIHNNPNNDSSTPYLSLVRIFFFFF